MQRVVFFPPGGIACVNFLIVLPLDWLVEFKRHCLLLMQAGAANQAGNDQEDQQTQEPFCLLGKQIKH